MNWFKRDPFVGAVFLVSVLTISGEAWLVRRTHNDARSAVAVLDQKKQERENLLRCSPGPSEENERAVSHDLEAAREKLAAALATLVVPDAGIFTAPPPAKPIEAYFDIAGFVENTREFAAKAQVVIRPDEHFGFSSHASEGPAMELLPAVFRQRVAIKFLLEALFEAHPAALISVQRENPLTMSQSSRSTPSGPAGTDAAKPPVKPGEPADFFELSKAISLRVAGQMNSTAFRIEFSGQTRTLRTFLNRLASCSLPVVVRSVEAEPLPAPPATGAGPSSVTESAVPIIAQNFSRFRVIVEVVAPLNGTGGAES